MTTFLSSCDDIKDRLQHNVVAATFDACINFWQCQNDNVTTPKSSSEVFLALSV